METLILIFQIVSPVRRIITAAIKFVTMIGVIQPIGVIYFTQFNQAIGSFSGIKEKINGARYTKSIQSYQIKGLRKILISRVYDSPCQVSFVPNARAIIMVLPTIKVRNIGNINKIICRAIPTPTSAPPYWSKQPNQQIKCHWRKIHNCRRKGLEYFTLCLSYKWISVHGLHNYKWCIKIRSE